VTYVDSSVALACLLAEKRRAAAAMGIDLREPG
jgi:hypothetical protein